MAARQESHEGSNRSSPQRRPPCQQVPRAWLMGSDKSDEIEGVTTKLEQAAKLSAEVAMLPTKLSKLSKSQGETNKLQDKSDESDGLTTQWEQATELSAEVCHVAY